jgi:hypothetical protein
LAGAVSRQRGALGGDGLIRYGRVAVGAGEDALDERTPGGLAGLGRREQDRQPHVFLLFVLAGEQLRDPGRQRTEAFAAPRPGADQHQAADQIRAGEDDLLGDQATHRVRDDVDRGQAKRVDEADRVASHGLDGVGYGPAGGPDAGVVEQDDVAIDSEGIAQIGIVVVQGAHEVLEEHQRRTLGPTEPAVRESYAADLSKLRGSCVMRELVHKASVPAAPA